MFFRISRALATGAPDEDVTRPERILSPPGWASTSMHPRIPIRKTRETEMETDFRVRFIRTTCAVPDPLARTFSNESGGFTRHPLMSHRSAPSRTKHSIIATQHEDRMKLSLISVHETIANRVNRFADISRRTSF